VRARLMRRGVDFEARKRLLHRLASRAAFESAQAKSSDRRLSRGAVA
jgi:hypothetical protein